MITKMTIVANITVYEALTLMDALSLIPSSSEDAVTKRFHKKGISLFGIWINKDKFLYDRYVRNCNMYAEVNCGHFYDKKTNMFRIDTLLNTMADIIIHVKKVAGLSDIDASDVVDSVVVAKEEENTVNMRYKQDKYGKRPHNNLIDKFKNLEWVLQNISFSNDINTDYDEQYMKLLNSGKSLKNLGMTRTSSSIVRASEIEYRNNTTTLKISRDEKKGIHLILSLCKGKLESLKKSNDDMIQSRLLSEFVGRMETIEYKLWQDYLQKITGTGDYYSYALAEEKINALKDIKRPDKDKMLCVLTGVAIYKGVDEYLNAFPIKKVNSKSLELVKSKAVAVKYIKMLENSSVGINPVSISRRDARSKGGYQSTDALKNLFVLLLMQHKAEINEMDIHSLTLDYSCTYEDIFGRQSPADTVDELPF